MFRKMQWKIVCIFMALVMAIMVVVGVYMFGSIVNLYGNSFRTQMDKVMSGAFTTVIRDALEIEDADERNLRVNTAISAYSIQLGLSESRQCAVLRATDAQRISATEFVGAYGPQHPFKCVLYGLCLLSFCRRPGLYNLCP